MSDTLSTTQLQKLRQQRQILAMMGIEQWVQAESQVIGVDEIAEATLDHAAPVIASPVPHMDDATTSAPVSDSIADDMCDEYSAQDSLTQNHSAPEPPIQDAPVALADFKDQLSDNTSLSAASTLDAAQLMAPLVEQVTAHVNPIDSNDKNIASGKVAPFDLQGGSFGDWVLMVDVQTLSHDGQKLWHNITQALSMTCEHTAFPICKGMDSTDLANASLAGFVFKLGRSETVSVAALTPLPDGVTHPNMMSVPTLDAMLKDSALKRELWQKIAHHS